MSLHAITWAWSQDVGNPTRKLVLMALADYADEQGVAWPSVKHIAERACCGRRSVQRHLSDLADMGYLDIEERWRENTSRTSNVYRLHVGGGGCQPDAPPAPERRPPRASLTPPDPSVDPSGNPTTLSVDPWPTKPRKKGREYDYPEPFERAWLEYPKRDGSNAKVGAYKAFRARVKSGDDPEELIRSAKHYRQHVQAKGDEGTQFVKQAETFWGPKEPWREFINSNSTNGKPKRRIYADRHNVTPWIPTESPAREG